MRLSFSLWSSTSNEYPFHRSIPLIGPARQFPRCWHVPEHHPSRSGAPDLVARGGHGAKLFVQDQREFRSTTIGTRLLRYGERLHEIRQDIIALGRTDVQMLGLVRIGVIETVSHTWMVSFIESLLSRH